LHVKVLNIVTNRVVRVLGSAETGERFMSVALYQGTPKVDTQFMLAKAGSEGVVKTADQLQKAPVPDPTVYATSFKRRRFYCFSTRAPDESKEARDVLNEMPTEEERSAAIDLSVGANHAIGREAVLRTTMGDVHIKLFGGECPKTVENFTTHARNGYYDNVIFHRVIKGFMVQTGDPLGDGTGGESIWGGEFEDEFDRNLRHDRPFTVSMANAGPGTNGSQFFITTVPTPWLDNKHTVFGRVTKGYEVVTKIEQVRCVACVACVRVCAGFT
jgi:peptidylprolyl isomerase domain and WD repeat-containing protein 1